MLPPAPLCLPGKPDFSVSLRHPTGYGFGVFSRLPLGELALPLGAFKESDHHGVQVLGQRFKDVDIADISYQRAIIDIFVNAIYLYDDKIVLSYNFKSDARTISLSDIEISDLPQTVQQV